MDSKKTLVDKRITAQKRLRNIKDITTLETPNLYLSWNNSP